MAPPTRQAFPTRGATPFPLLLLMAICLAPSLISAQEPGKPLPTGEPFGDPAQVMTMYPGWEEMPVVYDPAIGRADLVINLDQSQHPTLHKAVEAFAGKTGRKVVINSGTCGITNRKLLNKRIDLGSFCCPPGREDRMPGLSFHTIGITPIALLVHPDNPYSAVSFTQAQAIFAGRIQRWSELGPSPTGKHFDYPIQPVTFLHCLERPGHWRLMMSNEEIFSLRAINVTTIPDMIQTVATNPRAIGWDVVYLALEHYRQEKGTVKALRLDGMDPLDLEKLAAGRYPLYRAYNIATWERNGVKNPLAHELVAYLKQFIEEQGGRYGVVSARQLRQAGWRFAGDELIGEPPRP